MTRACGQTAGLHALPTRLALRCAGLVALCCLCLAFSPADAQAVVYGRGSVSSPFAGAGGEQTELVQEMTIAQMLEEDLPEAEVAVTFSGEAIGERISGQDGNCWVNVGDAGKLIGVYMSAEQASVITNWGEYGVKGTELRITGTLVNSYEDDAGELEVRAATVDLISPGGAMEDAQESPRLYAAAALLGCGIVFWAAYLIRRRMVRR